MTRSQTDADGAQVRSSNLPRALISRFATPFASKQRSSVDHEIRLDEPFRQYFPGDAVKGAVVINATKPCRITHLVIRLHGYVKVVNNARQPGESVPYDENLLTTMRNRKGIEYYGNGFARLFEDECILCGDGRLFGNYQFRFELNLPPSGIPSSIDVRFSISAPRESFTDISSGSVRAWNDCLSLVFYLDAPYNDITYFDLPQKSEGDGKHRHISVENSQIAHRFLGSGGKESESETACHTKEYRKSERKRVRWLEYRR